MEDMPYKVILKGAGLTLERDVTKQVGDQIAVLILTGTDAAIGMPGEAMPPLKAGTPKKAAGSASSVREFLNDAEPKRSPDKIAAIAAYLQDHEGKSTFTRADIESRFEGAAEPVPGNLPRDINWAVRAGWIAEKSGTKGSYYVTNSGKDAVAKKFPKELLKKTRIEPQGKKATKKGVATP